MIDTSRLTGDETIIMRDALVLYCASLDKRIARADRALAVDDLTWRRHLADEILDALAGR